MHGCLKASLRDYTLMLTPLLPSPYLHIPRLLPLLIHPVPLPFSSYLFSSYFFLFFFFLLLFFNSPFLLPILLPLLLTPLPPPLSPHFLLPLILIHSFRPFLLRLLSPLLLRSAPDTARILCRSFTPMHHRQL